MHRKFGRVLGAGCAVVVSSALMAVLGGGYGPLPALGPALAPGQGVWSSATVGTSPTDETLRLPGMHRPATVSFDAGGFAAITAATDDDLFLAQGYVTARFRLTQLDLARRLGSGRLAELNGPAQLESDRFELRLGLLRTARAQWADTPRDSPAGRALLAYARGVNARLSELAADDQWPEIYQLTGARPAQWTPVDSLVVQGLLTQQLDFSTVPLDYALLWRTLGPERTMAWFPVQPVTKTAEQPYDLGPDPKLPPEPFAVPDANAAPPDEAPAQTTPGSAPPAMTPETATTLLTTVREQPVNTQHLHPNSNAWAANGPLVAGGGAVLAGDPHLPLSLPSYWFQVRLRSPGYDVAGGSVPGMPAVVIGRNAHVSWSITNAQTQATLYYVERTDPSRPGQYYWRGAWRDMEQARYTIDVRGGDPVPLTVDLTVHGPVMTVNDQRVSVTWMGNYPSPGLASLLSLNRASDFTEFHAALRDWRAPALNFVYADGGGNIGAVSAGYVPQVPEGVRQWLPMPGTGEADPVGTIPFSALPLVYNPPGHVVASTNQRSVGPDYPYYLGTSLDFDPGYRQSVILADLQAGQPNTTEDVTDLQADVTDSLAARLVPALLTALGDRRSPAADLLRGWDHTMREDSPAASVWFTFLRTYLRLVFQPWWEAYDVPVKTDPWVFDLSTMPAPLREALEQWTLHDPDNSAFTPPGGPPRDAATVMRAAFDEAVAELSSRLGPDPSTWAWGRSHQREIPSLTGTPGLGYGPYAADGDPWTVDAAVGGMTADFGPSWRMVVAWQGGEADALAIYPAGQSENPSSPLYDNLIPRWRRDEYLPLDGGPESALWTLEPAR
ncbi:penicillin acylase family protein [Actinophytocola oryzae]|uniref:Penicillin amidase n=1 Tax=Actinophytocola oryzae TaxID=502181 RepID=A0A4R7V1R8_9PSEU|nr:penicillin acylase family protein [Actinophytocola oryzae]TDV43209.1 penicillin amidase [Actinophytocola oryzae]